MCEKRKHNRIDKCMKEVIKHLNGLFDKKYKTVACCCGHYKYPMTILIQNQYGTTLEIFSGKIIKRKKRFYKTDKEGFYYIPEIIRVV